MNIHLQPIDRSNYDACIHLKVAGNQTDFVAPNIMSLVQAAYEPERKPYAVYDDETMIGFLLYDYDQDIPGWSMTRFMIDEQHQHKGYGTMALTVFLAFFKKHHPNINELYTSAETTNTTAIHLYEYTGFQKLHEFTYTYDQHTYTEVRMRLIL